VYLDDRKDFLPVDKVHVGFGVVSCVGFGVVSCTGFGVALFFFGVAVSLSMVFFTPDLLFFFLGEL
jgi:hypothetical protein